jgi:hypothetical protein
MFKKKKKNKIKILGSLDLKVAFNLDLKIDFQFLGTFLSGNF